MTALKTITHSITASLTTIIDSI